MVVENTQNGLDTLLPRKIELPPMTFPEFAPKFIDSENITKIKGVVQEMDEYEKLVIDQSISIEELADYLRFTGILDKYTSLLKEIGNNLIKDRLVIIKRFMEREGNDRMRAEERFRRAINECLTENKAIMVRPILGQMINDLILTLSFDIIKQMIGDLRARGDSSPARVGYKLSQKEFAERTNWNDYEILIQSTPYAIGAMAEEIYRRQNSGKMTVDSINQEQPEINELNYLLELIRENRLQQNTKFNLDIPDNPFIKTAT